MFKAHDIAKKQHRERAQPAARRKLGLLEKKKDYRLRRDDRRKKEAYLKLLRTKAEEANEDQFDFRQLKARTKDGVLQARSGSQALSNDMVKLLKTQDAGYIRTLLNHELRKIEKMKMNLMIPGEGKHTLFVDNDDELDYIDVAERLGTEPEMLLRRENRLRKDQLEDICLPTDTSKLSLADLKKLDKRINRFGELDFVRRELELQQELMKKGPKKKKVDEDGTVTYIWEPQRKR